MFKFPPPRSVGQRFNPLSYQGSRKENKNMAVSLCKNGDDLVEIVPLQFKVLGQIHMTKQCRPRSDCSKRSSLIRVYTVCTSICIFWTHHFVVMPICSILGHLRLLFRCPNFLEVYGKCMHLRLLQFIENDVMV